MSYRDDILAHTEECFVGIQEALKEPRVKALHIADVEEIVGKLRALSYQADVLLQEKRQRGEKA